MRKKERKRRRSRLGKDASGKRLSYVDITPRAFSGEAGMLKLAALAPDMERRFALGYQRLGMIVTSYDIPVKDAIRILKNAGLWESP